MARFLYLLRHAQSADKQPGQSDLSRELTPRGVKQALLIGGHLLKQNTFLDCILHSVAERARATASLVSDGMKFDPDRVIAHEDLYEASTRTFFQFINQIDDQYQHVMCVAHNPSISYVAEFITRAEIGDMSPAGLAIIQLNTASWKDVNQATGELVQYLTPEMVSDQYL